MRNRTGSIFFRTFAPWRAWFRVRSDQAVRLAHSFSCGCSSKGQSSAGITVTVAIAGSLSGFKVRSDVAMTGEVTLRGNVLAVGGIKDRYWLSGGIKNIVLPHKNGKDLIELPDGQEKRQVHARNMWMSCCS